MAKSVYIAGPLFSQAEREFLEKLVNTLAEASGLNPINDFFLPHRDGGELGKGPTRSYIFDLDIRQVDHSEVIVAWLDGQDSDSGMCIELGYGYAKGKKILGLLTDFRSYCTNDHEPHRPNLMIWGICGKGNHLFHSLADLSRAFAECVGRREPQILRI